MGRHKGYERDEVLACAMQLFWAEGYHAVTARQIADAAGINVATIYSEFGSKDELYAAALATYEQEVVTGFFAPLEAPGANLATVRETLRQFPAMARTVAEPPGCLVTNCVVDHAPTAKASHEAMARFVERVSAGFDHALAGTRGSRSMAVAQRRQLARHLVAVAIGLFVMTRARVGFKILDDVVASALSQIDHFATEHGID